MLFACYWYAIRVLFVCQYMFLCTTNMSFACHFHVLVCNLYVTSIYSYVMVFHRYVLVCHLYVSGVYSCVMECHSYVLACHPYVTCLSSVCHSYILEYSRTWFYHEPLIASIAVMLLHDLESKRSLFHTICLLH